MTNDSTGFAAFKWDGNTLVSFGIRADRRLEEELLQTPDMTPREQSYFFRMAFKEAQLARLMSLMRSVG